MQHCIVSYDMTKYKVRYDTIPDRIEDILRKHFYELDDDDILV